MCSLVTRRYSEAISRRGPKIELDQIGTEPDDFRGIQVLFAPLPCYEILGLTGVFAARMAAECQALQAVGLSAHPKGAVKRTNFRETPRGPTRGGIVETITIHVHCHLRQFCLNVSLAMILHGRRLLFVPMLVQQQIVGMSL